MVARCRCWWDCCTDVALDPLGHHAVTCRHGGDVVVRHNLLRDVVVDFCRQAHLSVSIEKGHGLTRDHSHSRPADVLISGWDMDKPAIFDVMVASPLCPAILLDSSRMSGVASAAAKTQKILANGPKCQELGWTRIPLAVVTFCNWGKEAHLTFSRLAAHLSIIMSSPKPCVLVDIYSHCQSHLGK